MTLFEHALAHAGIDVQLQVVTNGEAAVDYLTGSAPDGDRERCALPLLFFVDLNTPVLSGFELIEWVRSYPQFNSVCLVALSGMGASSVPRAFRAGVNAYLVKPPRSEELRAIMAVAGEGTRDWSDSSARVVGVGITEEDGTSPAAVTEAPPLRVLVAEDNDVSQQVARRMLAKFGCDVQTVNDGIQVDEALRRQAFDVVFLDVEMPRRNGLDTAQAIRRTASIVQPWIVAMTAHAMVGDRERCLAAGMNDYLSKPIRMNELQAAIQRVPAAGARWPASHEKPAVG